MEDNGNMEQRKDTELEEAVQLWAEIKQVDRKKGWERLMAELPEARRKKQKILWIVRIRKMAAVVVLLLAIGGSWWLWKLPEQKLVVTATAVESGQPRLILNNGQQIALGESGGIEGTDSMQGVIINRQDKSIVYTATDSVASGILEYNTLEIPRGTEYKLALADGTMVWLNADSRLRYPVNFAKDERRVFLEGEAYFEVTKDARRPFRVESVAQTVEVLGTQFNVYAYPEEQRIYTTLVEGSVEVTAVTSGDRLRLKPGEQAVVGAQNGQIGMEKVNIEQVISWKEGMFVFDDQDLESILRKVARWYNVEVFYKNNAAKELVFKGNLPRYGKLPDLLKVLESGSAVRFSLKGRSLVVE